MGKIEEALEQSYKAIELDSENAVYYGNKAFLLNELGRNEEALEAIKKAEEIDNYVNTETTLNILINKSLILAELEKFEESLEVTDKIIGMDGTNYEAYVNRCFALLGMGKYKEAVEAANIAIELGPDKPFAYLNRSIAFVNTEDYEKAIEDGETAIQLAINDNDEDIISKGYMIIGNAYTGILQYDKAIEMYQKAAEYNVNDRLLSEINTNMGRAYFKKNNFDEAIKFADIAIELNGKDDKPYVVKAEALLGDGKKEEAMETVLKAIEIKPDSFLAYNSKGLVLEKSGELEEALVAFDKAIELDSYNKITDLVEENKMRVERKIKMRKASALFVVFPLVFIILAIVIITKIKKTGMEV